MVMALRSRSAAGAGPRAQDMTSGVIWRQLVAFSLPVLASMLLQQLYSMVDGLVVGNFVSSEALGAVTGASPVVFALIALFIGLSMGASVVIAQDFGAHDEDGVRRSVHTATLSMGLLSLAGAAAGAASSPWMPGVLNMDPVLRADAATYLAVFSVGIPALMLYDTGAGILRAVGDSRRPLYVAAASAVVNVVLDLAFVLLLGWGVAGAAWATVISEAFSAAVVLALLARTRECYRLTWRGLRVDAGKLRRIVSVGIPSGVEMALIALSNLFVQAYINAFGAEVTTGWGIDFRIDGFVVVPMQALCMAVTTFAGQNYGAHDLARIHRGMVLCRRMCVGSVAVMALVCVAFADQLAGMFTSDAQARAYGALFIRFLVPFDLLNALISVDQSVLQGMGDAKVPMLINVSTFVVLRQAYLAAATALGAPLLAIAFGYPLSWIFASLLMHLYLRRCERGRAMYAAARRA